MRMRRKRHLEERLKNVQDYLIITDRDVVNVNEAIKDKKLIDYKKIFGNDNPVHLEVGCGKGGFIVATAKNNPNINFVAVEMMQNIILLALELAKKEGVKNLRFINSGAEYLPRYLDAKSIETIYLNFSPPYPNKSYENRRLTNDRFITLYKYLLKNDGELKQRTDDEEFFLYSFVKLKSNNFDVEIEKNIPQILTEYEQKFLSKNLPIYRLNAKIKTLDNN